MNIERRYISKGSLEKLFEKIKANSMTVVGPSARNGKISFREIENYSEFASDYIQTTQSSKETAFPRTEKILDYSKNADGISVSGTDFKGDSGNCSLGPQAMRFDGSWRT